MSLGLLMMTQSMEVEAVYHRVVALHLQGLEQDGSAHPSREVFQMQVAQGGYPGLVSEAVIKHGLTATQKEGVYVILHQIALHEGTPWRNRSRNLEAGTEAEALDEGCLLTCYL